MKRLIPIVILSVFILRQDLQAFELLPLLEQENFASVVERLLAPTGSFTEVDGRRFISDLREEVKVRYGIEVDLQQVVDFTLRVIADSGKFSKADIDLAQQFYANIITSGNVRECQKCKIFGKHKEKHKNKSPELVLPDHLAIGFCALLGGGLLLILPFGITQGLGFTLIGVGIEQVIQGAINGEKAYYAEPQYSKIP